MALKRRTAPSESTQSNIPNLEEKDYEMRLVYVADLGVQEGMVYRGDKKPDTQQIALGLEVIDEAVEIDGEEWPRILWTRPFNIFSSLTEKGNEIKFYHIFEPSAKADDIPVWENQLGKACSGTVVHAKGKGENADKVYDNISQLVPIPSKYADSVGEALTAPAIGDADDPDNPCTKALFGLPKWCWENRIDGNKTDSVPADTDEEIPY